MDINKLKTVLFSFEGSSPVPYIPTEDGKPLDNSGVTIGKGVDLGQKTPEELAAMGVDPATIAMLRPFFGLRGRAAVDALKAAQRAGLTIRLTDAQQLNLNDSVIRGESANFRKEFQRKIGFSLDELNENQQLALTSMAFQFGKKGILGTEEKPTNLAKQLKDRDMKAAAGNIATWTRKVDKKTGKLVEHKYYTRENVTSLLFQGGVGFDQINEARNYVKDPAIGRTLAQGQLPEELTDPFVTGDPEGILGAPFERIAPLDRVEPTVAPTDLQDWQEPGAFEIGEQQYDTMEELLVDRGLANPLRSNNRR